MDIYEKDYQSLKELINGKTYNDCKSLLNVIREEEGMIDFNYKSITCTISNNNGKPLLGNVVECWGENSYSIKRM